MKVFDITENTDKKALFNELAQQNNRKYRNSG